MKNKYRLAEVINYIYYKKPTMLHFKFSFVFPHTMMVPPLFLSIGMNCSYQRRGNMLEPPSEAFTSPLHIPDNESNDILPAQPTLQLLPRDSVVHYPQRPIPTVLNLSTIPHDSALTPIDDEPRIL